MPSGKSKKSGRIGIDWVYADDANILEEKHKYHRKKCASSIRG
jgi:hypothetical protein